MKPSGFSAREELANLPLLAPKEVASLSAAGLRTAREVLDHLPKRYEDRRRFDAFPNQASSRPVCLRGTVVDAGTKHFGPDRRYYEAVIMDGSGGIFGSGKMSCRWFNMPFIQKLVAVGQELSVYGKVKEFNGRLIIDHPEFEVLKEDDEQSFLHVERIVPIYRNISGIAQRRLREIVHLLLIQIDPDTLGADADVPGFNRADAYREVHFPESLEQAHLARRRFAFEEFFALQLNVVWRRSVYQQQTGRVLGKNTTLLKRFYESLPFDLTNAQKRSIKEIVADMRTVRPMNRLLQGDVGSGKTFVAMATMLLAIGSGCQAALMAPTQILAEQHYLVFVKWLAPLGIKISLKTGNRNETSDDEDSSASSQIIIGTHALLYDRTLFNDLGLVVIDEQHKFGVAQRALFIRQGLMPDVLVMTATPIPRTLTMTIYGDLDVSILDEKPPGRATITTAVRVSPKQTDVTKFIKDQLAQGRQVYLVYPLVEESEALKVVSATEGFGKWKKRLSGHQVDLIHGKLRPEEKEAVMRRFRDGETAALVSTTVIEVGVDVPNASVMILHHAERFGLAQLHQLRGRIGRGGHKGYCILLTDGKNHASLEKLRVLEQSSDGFVIAEEDLRLRGPGDVLGSAQSGLSELSFADFLADMELLREARSLAEILLAEDPRLENNHRKFRSLILDPVRTGDFTNTA